MLRLILPIALFLIPGCALIPQDRPIFGEFVTPQWRGLGFVEREHMIHGNEEINARSADFDRQFFIVKYSFRF
jgi:hypothetical protein